MFDQIKGIWKNINQVVVFGTAFGVAATVSFVLYRHYYLQKKLKVK